MNMPFSDNALDAIAQKVSAGERLSREDGAVLYRTRDLPGVARLADGARKRRHGRKAFYVYNQHVNYTNVCLNRCRFCAFARDEGAPESYTDSIEQVKARLLLREAEPIREIHIVGGLNPALPFDYYLDLLRMIRETRPDATIKAFTAVEIDLFAEISGMTLEGTIAALKNAGLGMVPGGGAEVLCERVWKELFPKKIDAGRWVEVMRAVHRAGLTANATLLYGHIETVEERLDHLIRLRELQDETGGFSAFIPLAFHSQNTELSHLPSTSGLDDLRTIAVARLMLDNFDHIKAYWVMIGEKLAQVALHFGADDLDGTIVEEKITHMAGATSPKGLTREAMERLISAAGFTPVERDSFYRPVSEAPKMSVPAPSQDTKAADNPPGAVVSAAWAKVEAGERLSAEEALILYRRADLLFLGELADRTRDRLHPRRVVTFVIDRNINYTNVCVSGCKFCAFYRNPDDPDAYVITEADLKKKIEETIALGGTQILLQGGMNPILSFDFYLNLLRFIHKHFNIHVHGFSPPEVHFMAERFGIPLEETIQALIDAGLNSIPGGGAEVLADEVRSRVSPHKCSADQWMAVMRTAHLLGLKTTATLMFGHLETPEQIIAHLLRIRALQDETRGFTAFIPWTFQPDNTRLDVPALTSAEYLRVLALSRLVLDNVPNLQASWVTQGDKIAQVALRFGANDLGSTMIEENVVAAAGIRFRLPMTEMVRLIRDAGYRAVQRDCFYNHLGERGV